MQETRELGTHCKSGEVELSRLDGLYFDWQSDELQPEDVLEKIQQLIREESTPALYGDAEHLTKMIMLLYENYYGRYEPEDFLIALKSDSFKAIMGTADDINLRGLRILHLYLYNYVPGDWRNPPR